MIFINSAAIFRSLSEVNLQQSRSVNCQISSDMLSHEHYKSRQIEENQRAKKMIIRNTHGAIFERIGDRRQPAVCGSITLPKRSRRNQRLMIKPPTRRAPDGTHRTIPLARQTTGNDCPSSYWSGEFNSSRWRLSPKSRGCTRG